ncbi:DUF6629 family protein [Flavobacterium sp. GNP001]
MFLYAFVSFGLSFVLLLFGVFSLKKVQHQSQVLFATIPIVLCIQQFCEGVLWLVLPFSNLHLLQKCTVFFHLNFTQVVWPLYIPIAILFLEKHKIRKIILGILVGIGLIVSCFLAHCLCNYSVHAQIYESSILYIQPYPEDFRLLGSILYGTATIVPCFISHIKLMRVLGVMIFFSYCIGMFFYQNYLISVWCFFTIPISYSVWFILKNTALRNAKDAAVLPITI